MGKGKSGLNSDGGTTDAWRSKDPKYMRKTEGGVYFYSSESPFPSIDPNTYNKMPKYAQQSVVQLLVNGVSTSGWFMTDKGIIYMNHVNSDFMGEVRAHKKSWVNANGFNGDVDKAVVDDWST